MMLHAIPAGETSHHCQRTCVDRRGIALCMFCHQFGFADLRIALVAAIHCATVGEEMLGGCSNMLCLQRRTRNEIALQANGHRACISGNQCRV